MNWTLWCQRARGWILALRLRLRGGSSSGRLFVHRFPRLIGPGRLVLGGDVGLFRDVAFFMIRPDARIEVGSSTYLNERVQIRAVHEVTIGERCAIAWDVSITDTDSHELGRSSAEPIHIGDHVWIGARALILKGVTIGDGAVIAAGAVVNRDVPPRTLVAGVPARPVRQVDWH